MKLSSIFSVRNVLRASGCLSIILGAPMVIVPAAALSLYMGNKHDDQAEKDKKTLRIMTRGFGIVGTASGLKSLLCDSSKINLAASFYQEALFLVFHLCNRLSGEWKDAKCERNRSTAFVAGGLLAVAIQGCTLACSKSDDKDDSNSALSK